MRSADHDVGVLAAVADVLAELEWHGLADEYQALAGSLAEVSTVRDSDAFMALTIELWELADPTTVDRFDPWERALAAARVAVGNAVRAARSGLQAPPSADPLASMEDRKRGTGIAASRAA